MLVACGTDAERLYAGWSTKTLDLDDVGYRLRYQSPPWKSLNDDPLVVGSQTVVPIGGMNRTIAAGSAVVLEIAKESGAKDPEHLSLPKYRLESALVRCEDAELELDQSCAHALAGQDYTARLNDGDFDLFGPEPREGKNDFDQIYYELMGQVASNRRYRRVVFFESHDQTIAMRLFIEGNPDLGEREITLMVDAVELLSAAGAP